MPTYSVWIVCRICGEVGRIRGTAAQSGAAAAQLSAEELADLIRDIATTSCSVCGGPMSIRCAPESPELE